MSTLQQNWNSNEDPLYSWCLNSVNIQNSLSPWSKIKYGNIDRRIEELQKKIASRFRPSTYNSLSLDHIILEDLAKQEMLWKQKAHDNQINFGAVIIDIFFVKWRTNGEIVFTLLIYMTILLRMIKLWLMPIFNHGEVLRPPAEFIAI